MTCLPGLSENTLFVGVYSSFTDKAKVREGVHVMVFAQEFGFDKETDLGILFVTAFDGSKIDAFSGYLRKRCQI